MNRLSRFWHNPIVWLAICLIIGFFIFHKTMEEFDPFTLFVISTAYTYAVLSMAARTGWSRWSILGSGLLATMAGDALFYLYVLTSDHPPPVRIIQYDIVPIVVRDLFFVGSLFVITGLIMESRGDRTRGVWHRLRPGRNRRDEPGASS